MLFPELKSASRTKLIHNNDVMTSKKELTYNIDDVKERNQYSAIRLVQRQCLERDSDQRFQLHSNSIIVTGRICRAIHKSLPIYVCS